MPAPYQRSLQLARPPTVPLLTLLLLTMPRLCPSPLRVPAGGFFDPLNLASDDSERTSKLREAEIKHARLAMVSFLGYTVQAWYTGEGALGSLQKFSTGF